MISFMLFLHLAGFTLWLGGALAVMVIRLAAKHEEPAALRAITRGQAAVVTKLVGPGAFLVVVSGLVLTVKIYPGAAMASASPAVFVMQATGFVGALLVLLVQVPTAVKLARTAPTGDTGPLFLMLRKRQAIVSSIAGALGVVALVAGALL